MVLKVLAVNGSPRSDRGNTARIMNPFLDGMRGAGAEVELFHTAKLTILPCTGEFNCWTRTPGVCHHDDDMAWLYPKLRQADVWVFGTPVYVDGVTGPLKNLIDRLIPLIHPYFEMRDGHFRHPLLEGTKEGQVVLVSNCGFWEMDNFDPLLVHMKAACKNMKREFAGALLRPHGPAFHYLEKRGVAFGDVLEAAKEAGRQLVMERRMSPEVLRAVGRDLMTLEDYRDTVNAGVKQALDRLPAKR